MHIDWIRLLTSKSDFCLQYKSINLAVVSVCCEFAKVILHEKTYIKYLYWRTFLFSFLNANHLIPRIILFSRFCNFILESFWWNIKVLILDRQVKLTYPRGISKMMGQMSKVMWIFGCSRFVVAGCDSYRFFNNKWVLVINNKFFYKEI